MGLVALKRLSVMVNWRSTLSMPPPEASAPLVMKSELLLAPTPPMAWLPVTVQPVSVNVVPSLSMPPPSRRHAATPAEA